MFLIAHLRTLLIASFAAIFITACGGGNDSNAGFSETPPSNQQPSGGDEVDDDMLPNESSSPNDETVLLPPMPGSENDMTLEGVDSDADGIRDDVQIYIAQQYSDDALTNSALNKISILQQRQLENVDNKAEVNRIQDEIDPIIMCWMIKSDLVKAPEIIGEYGAIFYNTSDRFDAYGKIQLQMSGRVSSAGFNIEFERDCESLYLR